MKLGDVILEEEPFMVGPKAVTKPICLGCYKPVNGEYVCSKCGWPLCSKDCESSPDHKPECELTVEKGVKIKIKDFENDNPQYQCLTPMRCLWLKEKDPEKYKRMLTLQSHSSRRYLSEAYNISDVNVVGYLQKVYGLEHSTEEIHQICEIWDTNCFEVKRNGSVIRGLYQEVAIFAHNCLPSIHKSYVGDKMIVRAAKNIKKGEIMWNTYTHALSDTRHRLSELMRCKCFRCYCRRCIDPTEDGTFLGAYKCLKCKAGYLIATDLLESRECDWQCQECKHTVTQKKLDEWDEVIEKESSRLPTVGDPHEILKAHEKFLSKYDSYLHPNNHHLMNVKETLSQMYGRLPGLTMKDLTMEQLKRKEGLCKKVFHVLDLIEPDISRIKGK